MELLYFTINFVIFVLILVFILRKPVLKFLSERKEIFISSNKEAQLSYEQSLGRLDELKVKLSNIEKEGRSYVNDAVKNAKTNADIIIFNASSYSKNVLLGSEELIDEEVKRAKEEKVRDFIVSVVNRTKRSVKAESSSRGYGKIYMDDYFMEHKGNIK